MTGTTSNAIWEQLGNVDPKGLVQTRLQLHYAAQLVAAVGHTLAEARPDDSHTSMEWDPVHRLLVGMPVTAGRRFRAGLAPERLELTIVEGTEVTATFALIGRSMAEALDWLTGIAGSRQIALIAYEEPLPSHPIAQGAAFDGASSAERAEITRYYANTHLLLSAISAQTEASPIRLWPHHFDLATLLALAASGATIGIGVSPGDPSYAEPYWYASPWPAPAAESLSALAGGGHWHTAGWVSGVLTASTLIASSGDPAAQERQVQSFVTSAAKAVGLTLNPGLATD